MTIERRCLAKPGGGETYHAPARRAPAQTLAGARHYNQGKGRTFI